MAYDYIGLTNEVLRELNETELTTNTFASATGFQATVKDYVNASIKEIYKAEDGVWPFAYSEKSFVTVAGTREYSKDTSLIVLDWKSFSIRKPSLTVASLTSSGTTATLTVTAGHQCIDGDTPKISGATPDGYNGTPEVTITSSTILTYTVTSGLTSPATGTIKIRPVYTTQELGLMDYNQWKAEKMQTDVDSDVDSGWSTPESVVRKLDNNFILTPTPDRVYTGYYEGYAAPSILSSSTDTTVIPESYKTVIIDYCLMRAYMFRDNLEEAAVAEKNFTDGLRDMRRELIPQSDYMRFNT